MDSKLSSRLTKLARQIRLLEKAEQEALTLDAGEKIVFSELFLKTAGTVADREARVYASKAWREYSAGHVTAKVAVNKARRLLDLLDKSYQSEYLTYKLESSAIRRGVE